MGSRKGVFIASDIVTTVIRIVVETVTFSKKVTVYTEEYIKIKYS